MKLADYLKEIGLYEQVVNGIKKFFRTNTDLIQFTLDKIDDCNFTFMDRSVRIAGTCKGMKQIRLHTLVAERPADRKQTMLHEVAHLIRNCKLAYYGEDDNEVRFQVVISNQSHVMRRCKKRRSPHGREWKSIMISLGAKPNRCHEYDYLGGENKEKYKHKYTCQSCGKEFYTQRKLKNLANRHHSGCKRKPNNGRLTHTQLR